jgi:prepilin-type N-terminal cleavage/methylation domain-containing protein
MREIIRETKKHDFRKDSGFTLIEILVSLAILLLVAMFILPMVFQGFKMLEKSSHKRLVLANESGMLQIVHASQEGLWFSSYLCHPSGRDFTVKEVDCDDIVFLMPFTTPVDIIL